MKRIRKYLIVALIVFSTVTASAATYTLVSANYPINVNGQKIAVEPLNYNGTTYLPLRAISEAVGVDIQWDNVKRSVEINTVDIEALKAACVMIYADDGTMQAQGSAVYWDYNQLLTAYHVLEGNRDNVRISDGTTLTAKGIDSFIDIVTLDSPKAVKPVKIGDSDDVKVADKVIVIGAPQEKEDTVTYTTVKQVNNEIILNTSTDGGGSGSAVFDSSGNLIGIVIARDKGLNETYVTPINTIRKAL